MQMKIQKYKYLLLIYYIYIVYIYVHNIHVYTYEVSVGIANLVEPHKFVAILASSNDQIVDNVLTYAVSPPPQDHQFICLYTY